MAYCPECSKNWDDVDETCPICGADLKKQADDDEDWRLLGTIETKLSAGLAENVLKSAGIPAVVISRSGFFGNVGLPLDGFYSGKAGNFELSVPSVHAAEAIDLLDMTLGREWNRRTN